MVLEKYRLFVLRLNHPKDVVLEILPLLIAKSIYFIVRESVTEKYEELHGMLEFKSEQMLFLFQFAISVFNDGL